MNHTEEKNEKNTKEKMLTKNMIKISMIKLLLREVVVQLMKTCNCLEIWVINNQKKKLTEQFLNHQESMLQVEEMQIREEELEDTLVDRVEKRRLRSIIMKKKRKKRQLQMIINLIVHLGITLFQDSKEEFDKHSSCSSRDLILEINSLLNTHLKILGKRVVRLVKADRPIQLRRQDKEDLIKKELQVKLFQWQTRIRSKNQREIIHSFTSILKQQPQEHLSKILQQSISQALNTLLEEVGIQLLKMKDSLHENMMILKKNQRRLMGHQLLLETAQTLPLEKNTLTINKEWMDSMDRFMT